jgi:hypothetical protein
VLLQVISDGRNCALAVLLQVISTTHTCNLVPIVLCCAVLLHVIPTARTCNLVLIVLDCLKPLTHKKLIEHELEGFGIRLNKRPPQISFKKKDKGGINFTAQASHPTLDLDAVKAVCAEYRCDMHV